jgi:hypothetical protein
MQANLPYDCMGECSAAAPSLGTMSTCVGGLFQLQCAPVRAHALHSMWFK